MIPRLAACVLWVAGAATAAPVTERPVQHAGARFRVVTLEPQRVELVWKDPAGVRFETFDRVQAHFAKRGRTVRFLMNAGIFEPGGVPSGLHVEAGKTLRPLNLADAPGNFFLKPNGTCALGNQAAIGPSEAWRDRPVAGVKWALQSGPLLLHDGRRHPAFRKESANRLHRNGVGIDAEGRFVFAITAPGHAVNLWDFAGLFLKLGCKDALFLDGDISQMAVNPAGPVTGNRFGAILVVADDEPPG